MDLTIRQAPTIVAPDTLKLAARFGLLPVLIPMTVAPVGWLASPTGTALSFYALTIAACLAFPRRRSSMIIALLAVAATILVVMPGRSAVLPSWLAALAGLALAAGPIQAMRWRRLMTCAAVHSAVTSRGPVRRIRMPQPLRLTYRPEDLPVGAGR